MLFHGKKEIVELYRGRLPIIELYLGKFLIWQGLRSCFGSGYWINNRPWLNDEVWKNF